MTSIAEIFRRNRIWVHQHLESDLDYFKRLSALQAPQYLWIGCSDSRVPANVITGLEPGEVFVHRNVANLVNASDMNGMAVLQYAVEHLKIRHIIVCGHYGCGGIKAALESENHGLVDYWLEPIRALSREHCFELDGLSVEQKAHRLCELSVCAQVANISQTPIIRRAWSRGETISIHGWVYSPGDGLLRDLECDRHRLKQDTTFETENQSNQLQR
jgi:carbonic anhydrase